MWKAALFLSQVRPFEPAPLPADRANKTSTHICRFAFHAEEFFEFQQPTFWSHGACVTLGDLSGQCLTVTGVFVSGGQAGLWLLAALSYLCRSNPNVVANTSIYHRLFSKCFCLLKDNINVDEAAHFLVENILANDKGLPYEESNGDRIKLDQETVAAESKSGCC